jgi:hypothetical protein
LTLPANCSKFYQKCPVNIKNNVNSTRKTMTRRSNQEIERYYFDLFRSVYPLPEGQIKYGDKPDVIIEGQRKIGIEVTNLFFAEWRTIG